MGCVMSTAVACLLCNNRCSIGRVVSNFAFFPPTPRSYSLEEDPPGSGRLRLCFTDPEYQAAADRLDAGAAAAGVRVEAHFVETSRKGRVALLHFKHPAAKTTLLWSHGNAIDIGELYFSLMQLVMTLCVNVVAYDYSGYGMSTGRPSEANCYADIKAAYAYTCRSGVDPASLVLYGQSVGSAPSLWLANRAHVAVASVVLHTPLLSGLRVLIPPHGGCFTVAGCCSPTCVYSLCDPFPNRKRIRRVKCPVLLMHGTADTTVDCSHTHGLYRRCPAHLRHEPYILPGAGHDNLVEADPQAYFAALGRFIEQTCGQARAQCDRGIAPVPPLANAVGV